MCVCVCARASMRARVCVRACVFVYVCVWREESSSGLQEEQDSSSLIHLFHFTAASQNTDIHNVLFSLSQQTGQFESKGWETAKLSKNDQPSLEFASTS